MRGSATAAREMLKVWAPLALIVATGFLVAYRYVGSPPPRAIRIATGAADGAYHSFAQQYARLLARHGITLEVIPTAGTVDNLELLKRGEVSLALVQGGCATDAGGYTRPRRSCIAGATRMPSGVT